MDKNIKYMQIPWKCLKTAAKDMKIFGWLSLDQFWEKDIPKQTTNGFDDYHNLLPLKYDPYSTQRR